MAGIDPEDGDADAHALDGLVLDDVLEDAELVHLLGGHEIRRDYLVDSFELGARCLDDEIGIVDGCDGAQRRLDPLGHHAYEQILRIGMQSGDQDVGVLVLDRIAEDARIGSVLPQDRYVETSLQRVGDILVLLDDEDVVDIGYRLRRDETDVSCADYDGLHRPLRRSSSIYYLGSVDGFRCRSAPDYGDRRVLLLFLYIVRKIRRIKFINIQRLKVNHVATSQ